MLVGKEYTRHTDAFTRLFVERADEVMTDMTELFDIVPETITALRNLGIQLGIVTLKYRYRVESVLKRDHLSEAFEVIVGFEDVSANRNRIQRGLLAAVERLRLRPPKLSSMLAIA